MLGFRWWARPCVKKQNKTEYPTFLGPINAKHYDKQWEDCLQAGHVGGRGKQISRLTWSTQRGQEQLWLHKDIPPQTNKQQKDCSKSLIFICYTAMNNHMSMYPVPFWALLSLTAWSRTAAQDNLVLRVILSLCLLSLEIAEYSTPVFYLCLSTVFPNVHRGTQSSKWVTELPKGIFSVPHLFFCVPITAITLLIFLVVWTSGSPSVALLSLWKGPGQALPHLCDNSYFEVPGCIIAVRPRKLA